MRYIIITLLFAIVVIFSCNTSDIKTVNTQIFNTDSLQAGRYIININKDTLLQTINGAWLKIAKQTFSADSDKVELEIKEAYTLSQIISAGLTTQSNGQMLSSGGMIYINAVAGQKVTIKKPIRIAIPASHLQKDMELFKGQKKNDGTVDWTEPKPLDKNSQLSNIEKGAVLFQQKCASCHGIGEERETGPNLANVTKRLALFSGGDGGYSRALSHYFKKVYIPYEQALDADDTQRKYLYEHRWSDPYICNLINLFNKEVDLSADFDKNPYEWLNIYKYIENESNRRNLPYPRHAYLSDCVDSCKRYEKLKDELETKRYEQQLKRETLIKDNGPLVDKKPDPTWRRSNDPPPPDFSNKVQPEDYPATYYQFTIESFGWFNIDMMINKAGTEESTLLARVVGTYREKIKIYLIIPSLKVYGEGGPSEKNKDEYMFYKKDGTIPLPQNEKAFILAVTETETSFAWALTSFTTKKDQQVEVSLKTGTKEEFKKVIESIGADNLSITVKDSKNAAGIRDADKTIKQLEEELKKAENLKPKGCDCNCGKMQQRTIDNKPVDESVPKK